MKCLAVAVFSIFFLFFSPLKAAALPAEEFQDTADHLPAPFDISAGAYILMEMETGRVLAGQDIHERLAMASTTKIMTALLTLEQPDLDTYFTVDAKAILVEGSSMGLLPGDQVTLRGLAVGMLLHSGNDSADAAAVKVGGSTEGFVAMMNDGQLKWGLPTHILPHRPVWMRMTTIPALMIWRFWRKTHCPMRIFLRFARRQKHRLLSAIHPMTVG